MLTRPALSLKESDLTPAEGQIESTHEVTKVTFLDSDGTIKQGFRKPCNKKNYPPLLAKYVVAFSVAVRAALGERASEERLIYNDEGDITGTVSIAVPNFIPMLASHEKYGTAEKEKLGNPDKKTLIEYNVAELKVSAYKHKNNDLHPSNISVNGLIDWDELYYQLTSIIKGERYLSGYLFDTPSALCEIKVEEIRALLIDVNRIHWPGNKGPLNFHPFKYYKTGAFRELQGDAEYIPQYFSAILKELLAFDKIMLKKRMELYLGNEPLNLKELDDAVHHSLLAFGKPRKLFLDDENKERSFIDHCMLFLEQEHHDYKTKLLSMTELHGFLALQNKRPDNILNIKKWFLEQNKYNIVPYDLAFIDTELHRLWRECFKQQLADDLFNFDKNIKIPRTNLSNKKNDPCPEVSYEDLEAMFVPFIQQNDESFDIENLLLNNKNNPQAQPFLIRVEEVKPEEKFLLRNAILQKIGLCATNLYKDIYQLINEYQDKSDATIDDNHAFIENAKKIMAENQSKRQKLAAWLNDYAKKSSVSYIPSKIISDSIFEMTGLFSHIDDFTKQLTKTLDALYMNPTVVHLLPDVKSPTNIALSETKEIPHNDVKSLKKGELIIHSDETIGKYLSTHLKPWVTPERNAQIKKIIEVAYKEDYCSSSYFFWRSRTEKDCEKPLREIFSEGNWNATSLKTFIVKGLCLAVITQLEQEQSDDYFLSMHKRIRNMDNKWWGNIAQKIAEQSNLLQPLSVSMAKASIH